MITRENYECVFIDYLDGNLSDTALKELTIFLEQNSDLNDELLNMKDVTLHPHELIYPEKSALKRSELLDVDTFDTACISDLEGDLNSEEAIELSTFLQLHPDKNAMRSLFDKTVSVPDQSIVHPNKETLYRKAIIWWWTPQWLSIAAAVILALFIIRFADNPWKADLNNYAASQLNISKEIAPPLKQNTPLPIESKSIVKNQIKSPEEPQIKHTSKKDKPAPIKPSKSAEENQLLARLETRTTRFPVHTYIYKPQMALLENTERMLKKEESTIQKLSNAGTKLLTNEETGKLKGLPRENIQKGVLSAIRFATNNKLNISTGDDGKLKKLNLNSNLLAFSIPLSRN